MRNELVGDVRDVITSFLKYNRMKPSTSRCDDIGGVSARETETETETET